MCRFFFSPPPITKKPSTVRKQPQRNLPTHITHLFPIGLYAIGIRYMLLQVPYLMHYRVKELRR